MYIDSVIDLKNKIEGISFEIDSGECEEGDNEFLYYLDCFDEFEYIFDNAYYFGDEELSEVPASNSIIINPLFYTVCDLLSINFEDVSLSLLKTFNFCLNNEDFKTQIAPNIAETLTSYHPLLIDDGYCDTVYRTYITLKHYKEDDTLKHVLRDYEPVKFNSFDSFAMYKIKECFWNFQGIIDYIDKSQEEHKLLDPSVFRKYVSIVLRMRLIEFRPKLPEYLIDKNENFLCPGLDEFLTLLNYEDNERLELSCKGLIEYIVAVLYYILINNMTIKHCENCGKFFVAYNRSDTLYCDRPSPQDEHKTCKEYGTTKLWYDKLKEDETKKLYRNIYQQKQMFVRRNPDIEEYKTDFENFKNSAKRWKRKVKDGSAAESDYLQWLKDVKEKKVK